jgi:hypothetical protein
MSGLSIDLSGPRYLLPRPSQVLIDRCPRPDPLTILWHDGAVTMKRLRPSAPSDAVRSAEIAAASTIEAARISRSGTLHAAKWNAATVVGAALLAGSFTVANTAVQGHYSLEQAKVAVRASAAALADAPIAVTNGLVAGSVVIWDATRRAPMQITTIVRKAVNCSTTCEVWFDPDGRVFVKLWWDGRTLVVAADPFSGDLQAQLSVAVALAESQQP